MDGQTGSNISKKTHADKLWIAAVISLLLGISLFVLCLVLDVLGHSILLYSYYRSLEDVFALGIWVSKALIFFVVPFLGLIAIIGILTNWRSVTNPDGGPKKESLIRKIARRFLIASLFFALVSLLHIIFVILPERVMGAMSTSWQSIWLIIMALLALLMGCISYSLYAKASSRGIARPGATFAIILGLVVVGAVPWTINFGAYSSYFAERIEYSEITETFSVDSNSLKQTTIVPTLDTPCPKNKNIIWCSSSQLAWNRMKDDVIGAPLEVVGAEELAARLNFAEQSAADIESRSFYAAAGRIEEGIISKVQKDMAAKFPSHSVPDFNEIADIPVAILAYSYLIANVPFKYPYRQVRDEFIFTDSNGVETDVGAFGAWGYMKRYKKMREQAEILYLIEDHNEKEFAIDLCRHSRPYQVVAAVVEPKDSLAETFDYIRRQIEDSKQRKNFGWGGRFLNEVDVLIMPEMFWEIDHRFDELIGKVVANANPAMPIVEAKQVIKFRLDRYGAMLESEAVWMVAAIPRHFKFNRPFLVYMKKRDCEQPFFVMWVDNAELLNKK